MSSGLPARPEIIVSSGPDVLTVDEVAKLLRVNRKTIYDAIARKEIPGVRRLGRTIRIHREVSLTCLVGIAAAVPEARDGGFANAGAEIRDSIEG